MLPTVQSHKGWATFDAMYLQYKAIRGGLHLMLPTVQSHKGWATFDATYSTMP